jgi:AbrB family looped-hinge helix DNA binding protein
MGGAHVPSLYTRKIIDMRQGSCVITLPKAWLRYFGLKPGDEVEVITNGELTIRPCPLKRQDNAEISQGNTTEAHS